MRQIPIFLYLLLFSVPAFAENGFEPKRGDYTISLRTTKDVSYKTMSRIDSIDHRTGGVVVYNVGTYKVKDDGQLQPLGTLQQFDPTMKNTYISDLKAMCLKANGSIERITVPAGSFESCKVLEQVGDQFKLTKFYAANVPFGTVKTVVVKSSDPTTPITIELIQSGLGN